MSSIDRHPFVKPFTDIVLINDILGAGRGVGKYVGVIVVGLIVGIVDGEEIGLLFGLIVGEGRVGFCDWNWVDVRDGLSVDALTVGLVLGTIGNFEDNIVVIIVGEFEGLRLEGSPDGELVGDTVVGEPVGLEEGDTLGPTEGCVVGFIDEGTADGEWLGNMVDGLEVGTEVGVKVGI